MIKLIKKFLGLEKYVSELDQFLKTFDRTHPKLSKNQRIEKEKYQRIHSLRDTPGQPTPAKTFWDKF